METLSKGLIVYRASRLEALLGALTHFIDAYPPAEVLAPQTVIAAHPGMRQWLCSAMARQRGVGGIAANLDVLLPSVWLDRLARQRLHASAIGLVQYQRGCLRWRIHEVLDDLAAPAVQEYLRGGDRARRRLQLADRLARIYSQYLVYRPDWLAAWARGEHPLIFRGAAQPEGDFLAVVWAKLRADIGAPHRGELFDALVESLQEGAESEAELEPLHVFGVSHLAPSELRVFAAVAAFRPVVLYVPDPCREYWLDQRSDRQSLRERVRRDPYGPQTESLFLGQGHPLLGAWGRLGQHFMVALDDLDIAVDIRHWQDKSTEAAVTTRLQCVQESIRQLAPDLLTPSGDYPSQRADASLRIHACHTPLRELEVLRDALLKALTDLPGLIPADIVVMAPNMQAYVPLLPAVFGEAGKFAGPLPYHLADVPMARSHSLFETFQTVLALPGSRLGLSEIIDLLQVPDISRRLDLSAADSEQLTAWLTESRVAWALDPAFRSEHGVPAIAEHTFAWGMDRMFAGYVMGSAGGGDITALHLPDGIELAPLPGIHGPDAALLGVLDGFLQQIAALLSDGKTSRRASEWAQRMEQLFDGLFRVDSGDADAVAAEALLRRFIRAIASEPMQAGVDPLLEFAVVREVLLEQLQSTPERQRFLLGGVTFCGMVPQRAIPFAVVAVLGLNDGDFPRADNAGGLDLMARYRRLGDRDVRSDDRYLFLETLMSARQRLHLSYIGEGVRDGKPRNPAAPLAELLAALDAAAGLTPNDADEPEQGSESEAQAPPSWRPWRVQHPLLPSDARYFSGSDSALFSFHLGYAVMDATRPGTSPVSTFFTLPKTPRATAHHSTKQSVGGVTEVNLKHVLGYYRDPAKQLLRQGLGLHLDALDAARLRDDEPLEAKFDALDQVSKRLFNEIISTENHAAPECAPPWLRLTGLLPPGAVGELAWVQEGQKVARLLAAMAGHPLLQPALPPASSLAIDVVVGAYRLQGQTRRVYERGGVRWLYEVYPGKFESKSYVPKAEAGLDFKARIGFFLEWALLRLGDADGERALRTCVLVDGKRDGWEAGFNHWDDVFMQAVQSGDVALQTKKLDDLRARVEGLLDFCVKAQQTPTWYFPATSWAVLSDGDNPKRAALKKWQGDGGSTGERDYSPGYARLLAGEQDFDDETSYAALVANATELRALISLPSATEPAA